MNEATLKASLAKLLREALAPLGGIVYRHEDQYTAGVPDLSISHAGATLWVEVKLNRPGRKAKVTALQHAALLALHGILLEYMVGPSGSLSAVFFDYHTGGYCEAANLADQKNAQARIMAGWNPARGLVRARQLQEAVRDLLLLRLERTR